MMKDYKYPALIIGVILVGTLCFLFWKTNPSDDSNPSGENTAVTTDEEETTPVKIATSTSPTPPNKNDPKAPVNTGDITRIAWDKYQKPNKTVLQNLLSTERYAVSQEGKTEEAFKNEYWNTYTAGIYVDFVSGEPLFSSQDKYDSKTGYPTFTKPLDTRFIVERSTSSSVAPETEIRSRYADSHLGYIIIDQSSPTRKQYKVNSASLRFIAKENLEKEGYSVYLKEL